MDITRDLTMETLKNEKNYLPFSKCDIGLKPITILVDLQEGINGEAITKSQHVPFFKGCQAFYNSSVVYVMMKMT